VTHLRLANGGRERPRVTEDSEACFVDYSQCPTADLCWVLDLGCGCQNRDNCIIDTS
jgi:hypothetical protein